MSGEDRRVGTPELRERLPSHGPVRRVRWKKLSDEVAESLRSMILRGELSGGSETTQAELATLLGVSTMPIREALLRLAAEGFVRAHPNRSFSIGHTRPEDITDVYWLHAVLAGELAGRACAKADDVLVADLRALSSVCDLAEPGEHPAPEAGCASGFHERICSAADAPKLQLMLRNTLRFIPAGVYEELPDWTGVCALGHTEILRAFERREPEAARAAAAAHVEQGGELVADYFSSAGSWSRPRGG